VLGHVRDGLYLVGLGHVVEADRGAGCGDGGVDGQSVNGGRGVMEHEVPPQVQPTHPITGVEEHHDARGSDALARVKREMGVFHPGANG